jgi:hypothetical protein
MSAKAKAVTFSGKGYLKHQTPLDSIGAALLIWFDIYLVVDVVLTSISFTENLRSLARKEYTDE